MSENGTQLSPKAVESIRKTILVHREEAAKRQANTIVIDTGCGQAECATRSIVGSMSASITADTTEFDAELRRAKAMLGVVGVAVPMPEGAEVRQGGTVWGPEKLVGSFPAPEWTKPHTQTAFPQ